MIGYNSNQNLVATKNFVETDAFEIKEEDEEQCCTPLAQLEQHQRESQMTSNQSLKVDEVDESFQCCDYDEYMEEKCSLSDNGVTEDTQQLSSQKEG